MLTVFVTEQSSTCISFVFSKFLQTLQRFGNVRIIAEEGGDYSMPHSVPRLRKLKHHIKYIGLDNPFPKARAPVFLLFIHIAQAD